jgi:hypothetical protein
MRTERVAVFLLIAASVACGGSSPTNPSGPSNPSPSAQGTWVDAPPITIGAVEANPNVGNTFPFGGPSGTSPGTTYQQVYLGTLFGSGQIRVTAVEFFAGPRNGSREVASATYTFSMSTTTRAIEALDTANLASNIGPNQHIAFSGALGAGSIVDSRLRVAFSNPFPFSPDAGNLLMQIARSNPGPVTSASFLNHVPNDGFPSGQSSRAHDFGSNAAAGPAIYLVTRFHSQRCQCPTDAPCSC